MNRRTFLGLAWALGGGVAFFWKARRTPAATRRDREEDINRPDAIIAFHVAGVRFHRVADALKAGDRVVLEPGRFRGELCYEVRVAEGRRIGYVPRATLPLLANRRVRRARLSRANPDAVPWKAYEVTVWI
jgi:hypothetical protein